MKRMIITITLLLMICSILAEEPESMRSIATDGVFDGSWEYVFDPIDLGKIDSLYIFTNLSDFNLKYNDMYDVVSENSETRFLEELPLGIAFSNPFINNLKHAFFIRFSDTLTPSCYGTETEEYITEYADITGDGVYDTKTITYNRDGGNAEDNNLFDFIWNNHYQYNDIKLGFKISSFNSHEEIDNSQTSLGIYSFDPLGYIYGASMGTSEFGTTREIYDAHTNELTYEIEESGDFLTTIEANQSKYQFSLELDNEMLVSNSKLRFDLGFNRYENLSRDTNDEYYTSYKEIVIPDTLINTGTVTDIYKKKISIEENNIYVSTLLKKEFSDTFESEAGFWELGLMAGYLSGEKENCTEYHQISESYENAIMLEDRAYYASDEFLKYGEKGDFNGFNLAAHYRINLPLNQYAAFGLDGYYNYSRKDFTLDYESELLNVYSYQYGIAMDVIGDYVTTETEYLSADKETIQKNSCFRLPIALEFKMPDSDLSPNDGFGLRNFVFRLGSTFILSSENMENTYNVVEKLPNFVVTEYGDGAINEEHDSENTFTSEKTITKRTESAKRFSAGIGYKHSQNVSIDLGAYYDYDTEDYSFGIAFTLNK